MVCQQKKKKKNSQNSRFECILLEFKCKHLVGVMGYFTLIALSVNVYEKITSLAED